MYTEFVESVEHYKGFVLEIIKYRYWHTKDGYHKRCILYKDNESIACAKTKKELKELIDAGIYK